MNDMPVVYQSRAVTEPQREVARRSRDGGVAGTNYGNSFISPVGGAKSPQGDSLYAYPARESLWSPNGVAKIMQGAKPVRLAAEAFLLFVQKEPKYAWGCAPRPPNAKLRLDTNDTKASSVRRRRYALKVPAAHFILDFAGTELKINLISVVASDATSA